MKNFRLFSFTGYVQGMSDLLSPILMVMDDEVDAFWCFVGFMDHIGVVSYSASLRFWPQPILQDHMVLDHKSYKA